MKAIEFSSLSPALWAISQTEFLLRYRYMNGRWSAWDGGVIQYAIDLLDKYRDTVMYADKQGRPVPPLNEQALLNGADSWEQYSNGACSLIDSWAICERLCPPSAQNRFSPSKPWIEIQANALEQACVLLMQTVCEVLSTIGDTSVHQTKNN